MPQCTSASSSRVERADPGERHARPDRPPPSIGRRTGQSARMPPRGTSTTASAAPLSRSQSGRGAGLGWSGAGTLSEWERARCARIFRMTAGSCSVAIYQIAWITRRCYSRIDLSDTSSEPRAGLEVLCPSFFVRRTHKESRSGTSGSLRGDRDAEGQADQERLRLNSEPQK